MQLPRLPREIEPSADGLILGRLLASEGLGDGLPVVSPSRARVAEMLDGRPAQEPVGAMPPLFRELTVADVAVCAVLAGCGPAHLHPLLAAVRAVQDPALNLLGVATTTGNAAVGLVVHGPQVDLTEANPRANCMGPGNVTNAALGRALAFVLRAGGMLPGSLDMATLGQPAKYGFCFAEALHEGFGSHTKHAGLPDGSDAVTVFASSGMVEVADLVSVDAWGLLRTLSAALPAPGSVHAEGVCLGAGSVIAVIPPEWADRLSAAGIDRAAAQQFLHEHARVPVSSLPPAVLASLTRDVRNAGWIPAACSPEEIVLIVAGGVGSKACVIPLWPGGTRPVTEPNQGGTNDR